MSCGAFKSMWIICDEPALTPGLRSVHSGHSQAHVQRARGKAHSAVSSDFLVDILFRLQIMQNNVIIFIKIIIIIMCVSAAVHMCMTMAVHAESTGRGQVSCTVTLPSPLSHLAGAIKIS